MASHRYTSLTLIVLLFVASIATGTIVSAETCPGGTVAITTATRQAATDAGIPTSAQCWDPSNKYAGQAAGEAKAYLMQHATKNSNISCLNADYAEKLANLLKAVPGGPPTITDAYRSPQAQANLRAGSTQVGACGSYHQYGMAADFNNANKTTLLWMRIHAPEYGLTRIPALSILDGCSLKGTGFCDPAHIQIAAPLPPRNQCGICAATGGNGTLPATDVPTIPDDTQYYLQSKTAPEYSVPTQSTYPGAPIPTVSTPAATTPAITTNPPASTATSSGICMPAFSCSNNVMYYQTTSCTTQMYQNCTKGCDGNSCANIAATVGTSTLVKDPVTKASSSTEELLNAFANPVTFTSSSVATGTSIAVILNGNTSDIEDIVNPTSSSTINTGTIASIQPLSGQETFTSGDLGNTVVANTSQQPNAVFKILSDLKNALLWAIHFLTGK